MKRSRLVIRVTLMTAAVCLLMVFKYLGEHATALAGMTASSIGLQILALALHRITGSHRIAAHCFCLALWALFFGIASQSGGIDSPNLVANAFLVVLAPMLLGRQEALLWLGAGILTPVAQFVMTERGLVTQTLPLEDLRATRLSEYIATFSTVALTAHFFRRGQDRMTVELAREKHGVEAANQDLRVILDNAGQGFLSLDRAGRFTGEYSKVIATWFQVPPTGQSFASFLQPFNAEAALWFGICWEQIESSSMSLGLSLDQLPKRLTFGEMTFGLEYRPVNVQGEAFDKLVVIVSDLGPEIAGAQARRRQQDILDAFERILRDPDGFRSFLASARRDVDAIGAGGLQKSELWCCLHTLKGNGAVMGLSVLAAQCHLLEDELAEEARLHRASVDTLQHELSLIEERLGPLLSARSAGEVSLTSGEYQAILRDLVAVRPHEELITQVRAWSHTRVESHLGRLAKYAMKLAERLEKGVISVETEHNDVRTPAKFAEFWHVIAHVVRNAVDHGIESCEDRRQLGKGVPRLKLRTAVVAGRCVVEIADDGRGIDWQRVREHARELRIQADSEQELLAVLFAGGFSTSREVSDISGRGVGLSSVLEVCADLSISVHAESQPHRGTTFRFTFPEHALDVNGAPSH